MFVLIENSQVLRERLVTTPSQTAIIHEHIGMEKRIDVDAKEYHITVGEGISINLRWQKVNLAAENWEDDSENTNPFIVELEGVVQEIPSLQGMGTVEFQSEEAGEFTLRTVVPNVDNTEIKVVVTSA